nr:phage baseplate protein [Acidobacteriota bacterium]
SLGRRNAHLLAARVQLFGPELNAFAECPDCGDAMEFTLGAGALAGAGTPDAPDAEFDLEAEGYALRFRLLDSLDLRAAAEGADVGAARGLLVGRCVLEARRGEESVAAGELPEAVVERLAARLAECDPQAEVLVELTCPACESRWQTAFDIASFFYTEVSAQARRLLREVHALARAYAWREADILSMSARRRRYYLEMLGQ